MRGCLIALALALTAAPAFGQQLDPKKSGDQVQRYLAALTTCDIATLRDTIDSSVSSFGVRGQFAQSKGAYIGALQVSCRGGTRMSLMAKSLRQEEFGDIALSAFELTGSTETYGKSTKADLRVTLVLKRDPSDGVWRIIHSQTATAF